MRFRVTKIAAAVAVSLGTVVSMNVARADEVLFPYFVNSSTVTTILSVINTDSDATIKRLHYRYFYKQVDTGGCVEVDYRQPTSPHDVVTFDTGGVFGDSKGVLFEPAASQRNAVYDKTFAVFKNVKPVIGFALVDNNDQFQVGDQVRGEAIVLEFQTGSAWGYRAYTPSRLYSVTPGVAVLNVLNTFDFTDRVETEGEVLVPTPAGGNPDNYWVPVQIFPFDQAVTRYFVTPIGTTAPLYQLTGNATATIGLVVSDPGSSSFDVAYDRDENPISGRVPQTVTCVGRVDTITYPSGAPSPLITTAAQQFLLNGGWSNVAITNGQATVFKLEFNPLSPSSLDGKPINGSFNNSVWLRKGIRESIARTPAVVANGQPAIAVYQVGGSSSAVDINSPYPVFRDGNATATGLTPEAAAVVAATTTSSLAASAALTQTLYASANASFAPLSDVIAAVDSGKASTRQ